MKGQARRKFIIDSAKISGLIIGTAALIKEFVLPNSIEAAKTKFRESNYSNKKRGSNKILIAYASEFGTTGEVAEVIGKVLCHEGYTVEIKWVKNVKNLNNYDSVIIGSAIQYDRWMPEATEFVMANQNILSKLPVAYFFTCLVLSKKTEKAEHKAMAYSGKLFSLVPQIKPMGVGSFAGVLDYSKMSFFTRIFAKGIFLIIGVAEGDYRDWDAIKSWAKGIHFKLSGEQT